MILVKSSDVERACFLETKNLVGETNLKEKRCDKLLSHQINIKRP